MNENVNSNDGSIQNVIEVKQIEINQELKELIQPLSTEEYALLEQSIINEGCRDALILWNNTIVDGHNRYEICTKHNIPFNTTQMEFESINYAIIWIILNQFGRRNVQKFERGILANKLKDTEQKIFTDNQEKIKAENKAKIKEFDEAGPHTGADLKKPSITDGLEKKLVVKRKTDENEETIIEPITKDSREKLAEKAGVSYHIIEDVKKIQDSEDELIIKAAKNESIKITQAALLVDKDVDPKELKKAKAAIEIILNEANDKTQEELKAGKKEISDVLREIKKKKKSKQLEKKKEIYIEEAKAVMIGAPEVSLMDVCDFLNTFEDDSIDLLFTDPPYSTDIPNISEFTEKWLTLAIQKTKKTGRMLVFSGSYPIEIQAFLNVLLKQKKFIVDNPLIWTYKNTLAKTPEMHYNLNYQMIWHLYSDTSKPLDTRITEEMFSVQEDNAPDGRVGNRLHEWQKSDKLSKRLIRHTSKLEDLVVDCFTCTGTFIIAANTLGRVGKGCDIDQTNLDIAISRGCKLIIKEVEIPEEDE
jgi:DNA modification methylase